jgi:hypothetical protein
MKLKKLFHVLVVGGATLGATMGCGPGGSDPNGQGTSPLSGNDGGSPDGGTGGGGGGGGGPQFW